MESKRSVFIRDLMRWKWINFNKKKERGEERRGVEVEGFMYYLVSSKIMTIIKSLSRKEEKKKKKKR